jgi:thiol-disulfide isomerase/thioredoxin
MALRIDYIGATWCKVCVTVKPGIENLSKSFNVPLTVLDVSDVDEDEGVTKVPTVRVWLDNKKVSEITTKHIDELKTLLIEKKGLPATEDF